MNAVPVDAPSALVTHMRERLLSEADSSGGWGYYPGKRPRIESTAWALLALCRSTEMDLPEQQTLAAPHLEFLRRCQRPDGLLVDVVGLPPNLSSNGIAACVLADTAASPPGVLAGILRGLVSIRGIQAENVAEVRQNNSLQAWPWLPDTFSWVEPTSWCLLALKTAPADIKPATAGARLSEAETLLLDRSCDGGGWNYGNASVLGQDLRPYVPTTAVGLLALQDRRNEAAVTKALRRLESSRLHERSAVALSLAAITLRLFDRPVQDVEQQLLHVVDWADRAGSLQSIAMALYALTASRHEAKALRV